MVGPLVERRPDCAEVPRGGQLSVHEKEDGVGDAFDLLKDMRRDHDGAPFAREPLQEPLEVDALLGIGAVERLVQKKNLRIVDERPGEADSLAHAAGIGADPAIGGILEFDMVDGPLHSLPERGHRTHFTHQRYELAPGQESVHRLVLVHDPDAL